jgi:hypothetical protein
MDAGHIVVNTLFILARFAFLLMWLFSTSTVLQVCGVKLPDQWFLKWSLITLLTIMFFFPSSFFVVKFI